MAAGEKNVVMGLSMGGNIARYKLAEMTKAGRPTDVRLLILQDSPQRGANIPLGLSALVRQLQFDISLGPFSINVSDMVGAVKQANTLLDSPAARQLLLYQTAIRNVVPPRGGSIPGTIVAFQANNFIEGPYRQMISYAAPYRIIAVSQGSQCGQGLFAPYTELIRAGGRLNLFNLPFVLAGSTGFNGTVTVNAIPANGQARQVSGLNVFLETQLYFGLIRIRTRLARQSFSCPTGLLPLDGASGGAEGIGSQVGTTGGVRIGYVDIIRNFYRRPYGATFSLVNDFNFVPTPSALDIQDFTLPSLSGTYIGGVASVSTARVDAFLAQERFTPVSGGRTPFNQNHVSFTPRNTEWLFNQMENRLPQANQLACSTECEAITAIAGPGQLCSSSTSVFSVNSAQATWTAAPANLFTVSTGTGGQFATSAAPGAQGQGTLTATLACGQVITRRLFVGNGFPTGQYRFNNRFFPLTGTHAVGYNNNITISLDQPFNFTFTSNNPNVRLSISGNTATFSIPTSVHQVTITATATNPPGGCAITGGFVFFPVPGPLTTGTDLRLQMSPNPVASELTISADATASDAPPTKAFKVELYDTYGKKVRTQESTHGKAVLNVRDVPDGLYHVRVGTGPGAYSEHVQITH